MPSAADQPLRRPLPSSDQPPAKPAPHSPQPATLPFDPWRRVYAPFLAEFLGSLTFTLFSDLLGLLLLIDLGPCPSSLRDIALFEGALLLLLICAFRPICGAHFNPALTLASLLSLDSPLLLGLSLLFAQLFGAFFGSLLFHSAISSSAFLDTSLRLGSVRFASDALAPIGHQNGSMELDREAGGPFPNKFQVFLVELLCSSLLVLAHLFTASQSPLSQGVSVASARVVATAIGSRSALGQSANLARALANALLASIFLPNSDQFSVWRLFYCHLFGAICSAIVGAAIFWLFKFALQPSHQIAEQKQQSR